MAGDRLEHTRVGVARSLAVTGAVLLLCGRWLDAITPEKVWKLLKEKGAAE